MYFKLTVNNARIGFEARTPEEGRAKALRKIESIRKSEGIDESYGPPRLYCYGIGEREVWAGEMQYIGKPTHEQMHEISLVKPGAILL